MRAKPFKEDRMKKLVVIAAAVLFLAVGTAAFAFGPGGCGGFQGGGPGKGMMGPMSQLNLSKDQAEKMWKLKDAFHNDTKDLRYQMFQKRWEMKSLFADPKADDQTIIAKQKEANALRQAMQDKMVQFRLAERKILTPEQIQKLGEIPFGKGHGFGPCAAGSGAGPGGGGRGFGPGRTF
jgi:Spy/CpxP family protein refolding chaperone